MTRPSAAFLIAAFLLAVVACAHAEPKVIGANPPPNVRIVRGNTPKPAANPEAPLDLTAPAPAPGDSAARATARRMIDAWGGPAAFRMWVQQGERRGLQTITAPARVESRYRERRAGSRRRVDLLVAGTGISFVTGPEGAWQSFLGLVSDLPEREREELRVEESHDERLLLEAASGALPAKLDRGAATASEVALVVWGPRGSATRFRADRTSGRLKAIEFTDLDPRGGGIAFQVRQFDDWRPVGPKRPPLLSSVEGAAPLRARDQIEGGMLVESTIDTLDLGHVVADSVFLRPGAVEMLTGATRRTIVPLVRIGDHDFVDLKIGGDRVRRFLVDTGAGMTAVSNELAIELGIPAGKPLEVVGLGGGTEARPAILPPLGVGTLTLKDVHGLVLDLSDLRTGLGANLDGILGFSAFARMAVTFDFANKQLELAENASARVPGAGGTRLPFVMIAGQVIVPVQVDGVHEASFLVDSGAWRTFLPPELGARLDVPPERRLPGIPSSGADGRPIEAEALRVKSLRIGDVEVARPIVLVPAHGEAAGTEAWSLVTRERGVLGADVLRRFKVTIDFPRQEMTLEPARGVVVVNAPHPDEGEASFIGPGVVIDGKAVVVRVLADSPAAKAGVAVGERVIAIDGVPTGGASLTTLRRRLTGAAGSRVRLGLRDSAGRERTVAVERALLL